MSERRTWFAGGKIPMKSCKKKHEAAQSNSLL
jgi:hypothetical protein